MGWSFKVDEPVRHGIRRLARQHLLQATDICAADALDEDEAVHELRKNFKRTRGLWRLCRSALGRNYGREEMAIKRLHRRLGAVRDAVAMIEVVDDLTGVFDSPAAAEGCRALRAHLAARPAVTAARTQARALLDDAADDLHGLVGHVDRWRLRAAGFSAIAPGLEKTYCATRRARRVAESEGQADAYHTWRKQVKYHAWQARLLRKVWTHGGEKHDEVTRLDELAKVLGEDHDLAVLHELAEAHLDEARGQAVTAAMIERVADLRCRAAELGERCYGRPTGDYMADVKRRWRAWRR
jgi:CHAD domain-containing protein